MTCLIQFKKTKNSLRNTLFDKDKVNETNEGIKKKEENNKEQLVPANINSTNLPRSSGIFHDIKSMDGRLERLEDTFYNYAYDSTKVLTSFHKNTKILEGLINELVIKNEVSDKSLKNRKNTSSYLPSCSKRRKNSYKRKKEFFKTIIYYFGLIIYQLQFRCFYLTSYMKLFTIN